MKKVTLIILIIASCLRNFAKTGNKIYAVYSPPANKETHKVLKRMGINTVFIKPSYKASRFFKNKGYKVFISFPVFFNRKMLKAFNELHAIDSNGKCLPKILWYRGINPSVKWYRKLQLKKLRYIVKGFKANGIVLDFIRYPLHWEHKSKVFIDSSFDKITLKQFEKYLNKKIPFDLNKTRKVSSWIYKNHRKKWVEFKCRVIYSFVKKVKLMIKKHNTKMRLGVFMIPWKNSDYLGAVKNIAAQDISLLKKTVDFISPMVYHKLLGNNVNWLSNTIKYFADNTGGRTLPILQAFKIKPAEILKSMRIANTLPGSLGFILFGYKHLDFGKKQAIARYITGR